MSNGEQTAGQGARAYPNVDAFCDALRDGLRQAADFVTPPESAMGHFRQSRIEFWLGVRDLIDSKVDRMSRAKTSGASVVVE